MPIFIHPDSKVQLQDFIQFKQTSTQTQYDCLHTNSATIIALCFVDLFVYFLSFCVTKHDFILRSIFLYETCVVAIAVQTL